MEKTHFDPSAMKARLKSEGASVENFLSTCLANPHTHATLPPSLRAAMEYSLLAGGKRLRPVLCLTTAKMCGLTADAVMPFAAAIEMIHTYSLIHDDLPAMDDDDLRRGKASCHKQFDEATAILAGDALLTDAFAFMSMTPLPSSAVLAAMSVLARAAGSAGMVGGQVLDMAFTGRDTHENPVTLQELRLMHSLKTGALIKASCVCGALLAGSVTVESADLVRALQEYGTALGMAFQITDDILDVTADSQTLGKPVGSDVQLGKTTYPSLLGLERSRELAEEHMHAALTSLDMFDGEEAVFLRELAMYVVQRSY